MMLKTLLKKQLSEIFRSYYYDAKHNRARSRASTIAFFALFVVLMLGILGGMFTMLALALCAPLTQAGMGWLYFTICGLIAVVLGVFGGVFNTYAGLYLAKDNDLLLSMPIPVRTIMASRLLGVYLMGLMYSGMVILPAIIVWWVVVPLSVGSFLAPLLLLLLISVLVLTLSAALGWAVARISLKLKNKSFIVVILSLAFFFVYYLISFRMQSILEELITNAASYGDRIRSVAYPLYLFGEAGTGNSILAVLIVTAVILALFGLMWFLISRSFLKIATATGSGSKRVYRESTARVRSADAALLGREFSRFFSSPNYMLNCGLGVLLLPILGVFIIIRGGALADLPFDALGGAAGGTLIAAIASTVICGAGAMNDMAAPSISLEGKTLWMLHALPVRPAAVLRAKLRMQLILTVPPVLFCGICGAIVFPLGIAERIAIIVGPLTFTLLIGHFDLFVGLKLPNLTWTNEAVPVKQGGSVMICVFGGLICAMLPAVLGFLFANLAGVVILYALAALNLILCVIIRQWLVRRGGAVLAAL